MAKQKKIDLGHMTEEEKMKYEIAGELGLLDRVLNDGWRSLTAKETGRIVGLVTRRKQEKDNRFLFNSCLLEYQNKRFILNAWGRKRSIKILKTGEKWRNGKTCM